MPLGKYVRAAPPNSWYSASHLVPLDIVESRLHLCGYSSWILFTAKGVTTEITLKTHYCMMSYRPSLIWEAYSAVSSKSVVQSRQQSSSQSVETELQFQFMQVLLIAFKRMQQRGEHHLIFVNFHLNKIFQSFLTVQNKRRSITFRVLKALQKDSI